MSEIKSVFINGDRTKFLSKGSVDRFKKELRKKTNDNLKNINVEDSKYLEDGYVFDIKYNDNTFNVNIVTLEEYTKDERRKMLRKRLRQAQYNRSGQVKQQMNSLKRSVPDKLFKSYMNLMKQYNFKDVPSPKDVIENPERFTRQISAMMGQLGMVSNDGNANNALKKYFNTLGDFMGIEPMNFNIQQTPPVKANLNEDEDTEDEDMPEVVKVEQPTTQAVNTA
jgi:hypothetical protein